MVECERCGEEFESEDAYREHLQLRHGETVDEGASSGREKLLYLGIPIVALGVILAVGAGFVFLDGGAGDTPTPGADSNCPDAETEPHDVGGVHYHGKMSVVVDGEEHDLARMEYFLVDEAWHLEDAPSEGENITWHNHAREVTLQYALNTLPGFCAPNASAVQVADAWYHDDDPGTTVRYLVNGEEVDPRAYTFEIEDDIRVVVETDADAALAAPSAAGA